MGGAISRPKVRVWRELYFRNRIYKTKKNSVEDYHNALTHASKNESSLQVGTLQHKFNKLGRKMVTFALSIGI